MQTLKFRHGTSPGLHALITILQKLLLKPITVFRKMKVTK